MKDKCNCGNELMKGYNVRKTCCMFFALMGRGNMIRKIKTK